MAKPREWQPATILGTVYIGFIALTGIVLLAVLFIGTDTAFEESRRVTIPFVVTIRGDVEPPYWEFNAIGSLAVLFAVPLVLASVVVMFLQLIRVRRGRRSSATGPDRQ